MISAHALNKFFQFCNIIIIILYFNSAPQAKAIQHLRMSGVSEVSTYQILMVFHLLNFTVGMSCACTLLR